MKAHRWTFWTVIGADLTKKYTLQCVICGAEGVSYNLQHSFHRKDCTIEAKALEDCDEELVRRILIA